MSSLYHHIKHKILVLGSAGCGKTSLIESILSRSKCDYECQPSSPGIDIKQCHYSQAVHFHEIEIELKIFERTIQGALDRQTMQPFYCQLDTVIGVYDPDNFDQSFHQMKDALDSVLALYDTNHRSNQYPRPTVYVLSNVRDHRQCRSHGPYREVKEYVDQIGAIQLYHYCYSSSHIKAFHHLMMLNVYRQHFRHQPLATFLQAIDNCRRHVYMDNFYQENSNHGGGGGHQKSIFANLFHKLKFHHHHHHHHHDQHQHQSVHSQKQNEHFRNGTLTHVI